MEYVPSDSFTYRLSFYPLLPFPIDQPKAVDEQGVAMLEANLAKARRGNNQLKELMLQLEETASRQKLRIQTLQRSIAEIRADIKNLEEIRDNLPKKCYNLQRIERP